jgi:hypothetical protein
LSVLFYWRVYDGNESSLYEALEVTPKDGCEPDKIAALAIVNGLQAVVLDHQTIGDLEAALGRGDTVILALQAWVDRPVDWKETWVDGHYVVLAGMDYDKLYFMDPSIPGQYGYLPKAEFLERWHDIDNDNVPQEQLAIYIHGDNEPMTEEETIRIE